MRPNNGGSRQNARPYFRPRQTVSNVRRLILYSYRYCFVVNRWNNNRTRTRCCPARFVRHAFRKKSHHIALNVVFFVFLFCVRTNEFTSFPKSFSRFVWTERTKTPPQSDRSDFCFLRHSKRVTIDTVKFD